TPKIAVSGETIKSAGKRISGGNASPPIRSITASTVTRSVPCAASSTQSSTSATDSGPHPSFMTDKAFNHAMVPVLRRSGHINVDQRCKAWQAAVRAAPRAMGKLIFIPEQLAQHVGHRPLFGSFHGRLLLAGLPNMALRLRRRLVGAFSRNGIAATCGDGQLAHEAAVLTGDELVRIVGHCVEQWLQPFIVGLGKISEDVVRDHLLESRMADADPNASISISAYRVDRQEVIMAANATAPKHADLGWSKIKLVIMDDQARWIELAEANGFPKR